MEKFSLYDLLSLIFPGAIWLFMLDIVRIAFGIASFFHITQNWELIVLWSLILGGIVYVLFFLLIDKKWFVKITGTYESVVNLYLKTHLHSLMNETLNSRAKEWFNEDIYFTRDEWKMLSESRKKIISARQNTFYDRMYYELEYEGKFSHAKSFQGFYFFFRHLFLASLLTLLIFWIFYTISVFSGFSMTTPDFCYSLCLTFGILLFTLITQQLSRWYRKRMIMKMYWTFFTRLTLKK